MTQEALIRRLQISCLGLDAVDPLRLLVDDVIEALRENAMREVQRLGQEIEHDYRTRYDRGCYKCGSHYCPADCPEPLHLVPQQPEQEPVKYSDYEPDGVHHNKPEQEPVGYWKEHAQGLQRDYDSLLADFQAQRTWVGLTDEEIDTWNIVGHESLREFVRAIEAKLKERNT